MIDVNHVILQCSMITIMFLEVMPIYQSQAIALGKAKDEVINHLVTCLT